MHDLWRESARLQGFEWTEDMQVLRFELRFRRSALREMKQVVKVNEDGVEKEEVLFHGIDDAFMLESFLPGLWGYAVGHVDGGADGLPDGWLRYVEPSDSDVNRSRWPVHPDWQVIQSAFATPDYSELEREQEEHEQELTADLDTPGEKKRKQQVKKSTFVAPSVDPLVFNLAPYIRERKRVVNVDRMVAQVTGCMSTFEAWCGRPGVDVDLSVSLSTLYSFAEGYMADRQQDYTTIVHKKRVLYSIEESIAWGVFHGKKINDYCRNN